MSKLSQYANTLIPLIPVDRHNRKHTLTNVAKTWGETLTPEGIELNLYVIPLIWNPVYGEKLSQNGTWKYVCLKSSLDC